MMPPVRTFFADDDGATAIEYSLIAALIFLVILVAVSAVATNTVAMWTTIAAHV